MTKDNQLGDIFKVLTQENPTDSPHHFLFFLGTDTVFTPNPTIPEKDTKKGKDYVHGETISYTAQVITTLLKEEFSFGKKAESGNPVDPLSYSSESVNVLNGPTTLGTEVGDRIAQGIFLALRAVASGKETLEILGHSRGAVEAILVIHELDRIKKALKEEPDKSLYNILKDTPCSYTKTAVKKFFSAPNPSEDAQETRKNLSEKLDKLEINPFLIDPVPGGSYLSLFAWRDERFYHPLPSNCNEPVQVAMRDERTRCFKTIVPEKVSPIVIPGHHGTASGNLFTQQLDDIDKKIEKRDTSTVQNLVLYKILHHFHQKTGVLKQPSQDNALGHKKLDLKHPQLDKITNQFLDETDKQRDNSLIKLYFAVHDNNDAFQWLANYTYPLLGAENIAGQRIVHYRGPTNNTSMASIAPPLKGFVNTEHARLYLKQHVDLGETASKSTAQMVTSIARALDTLKDDIITFYGRNLEDSQYKSKLHQLISDDEGQNHFFDGLSMLVNTISSKYLRNHLSVKEKTELLQAIKQPFSILAELKDNEHLKEKDKQFFTKCQSHLIENTKDTLETYYKSLNQQTDTLHKEVSLYVGIENQFATAFAQCRQELSKQASHNPAIQHIDERLNSLTDASVANIHQVLNAEMNPVNIKDRYEEWELRELKTLLNPLNIYFEIFQEEPHKYIEEISKLYEANRGLNKAYPELKKTLGNGALNIDQTMLSKNDALLIQLAGKMLKEKGVDLTHRPENISESFFKKAKNQAISQGAADPEKEALQDQLHKAAELTRQQQQTTAKKENEIQEFQRRLETLQEANQQQQRTIADKENQIREFQGELDTTKQTIADQGNEYQQELEEKENEIEQLTHQLQTKQDENQQQQRTIADQENKHQQELEEKENEIEQLTHQLQTKQDESQQQQLTIADKENELQQKFEEKENQISKLQKQANDPRESKANLLIHEKLIPATEQYLEHLWKKAKQYNPSINRESDQKLPEASGLSGAANIAYDGIKQRYDLVLGMKQALSNEHVAAVQKVDTFKQSLDDANTAILKQHSDPAWKHYSKTCLAAIAVVMTGIVPGLVALGIYSMKTGQSPLFFSQSKGQRYINECQDKLQDMPTDKQPK